jgi:hypothetical protein
MRFTSVPSLAVGCESDKELPSPSERFLANDEPVALSIVRILRSPKLKPDICRVLDRNSQGFVVGEFGLSRARISLARSTTSDANVGNVGFL